MRGGNQGRLAARRSCSQRETAPGGGAAAGSSWAARTALALLLLATLGAIVPSHGFHHFLDDQRRALVLMREFEAVGAELAMALDTLLDRHTSLRRTSSSATSTASSSTGPRVTSVTRRESICSLLAK